MTYDSDTAEGQARAQLRSIAEMVAALECDYDRLIELREERDAYAPASVDAEAATDEEDRAQWAIDYPEEAEELAELEEAAGDCEDREEAEQRISEDPLSIEVRSGWVSVGEPFEANEFRIVLCTGGPHVELVGELDQYNEPSRVWVVFKDWGTSGELFDIDRETVLTYCRQFHFGEPA